MSLSSQWRTMLACSQILIMIINALESTVKSEDCESALKEAQTWPQVVARRNVLLVHCWPCLSVFAKSIVSTHWGWLVLR